MYQTEVELKLIFITPSSVREQSIVMSVSVCLSVCVSVSISLPNFKKKFCVLLVAMS